MKAQNSQYLKMRHLIATQTDIKEFKIRLNSSPIKENPYYLGLLLMSIVSMPAPKADFIQTLLKYIYPQFSAGADVNFTMSHDKDKSVLMVACENSVADNIKFLLKNDSLDVGKRDSDHNDILHYALRNQSEDEAIKIIDCVLKQYPQLIQTGKNSLIFSAILQGKTKVIEHLVQNYVDPNSQFQPISHTPLHYTIQYHTNIPNDKHRDIALLLLLHKANPYLEDYQRKNCFDYSEDHFFDLESLIVQANDQPKLLNCMERKKGYCLTAHTNTDTRTALSKDDQFPQIQTNNQKLAQFEDQVLEVSQTKQIDDSVLHDQQAQQIEQKQTTELHKEYNQPTYWDSDEVQNKCLSYEIIEHQQDCLHDYNSAQLDVRQVYAFLYHLGRQFNLELEFNGSFATGLWTPSSDINMVFINYHHRQINVKDLLKKMHNKLSASSKNLQIKELHLNADNQFPNIRLHLSSKLNSRQISIAIFQRKFSGQKYVNFIQSWLAYYPQIRSVFFAFHTVLESFNLHMPKKNGLKTYTIFLMILQSIQNRQLQYRPNFSEGELFMELIKYFTNFDNEYIYPQQNQYITGFNMYDPLNASYNTGGKNTDIGTLQIMLKSISYCIRQAPKNNYGYKLLEEIFELYRMHP